MRERKEGGTEGKIGRGNGESAYMYVVWDD